MDRLALPVNIDIDIWLFALIFNPLEFQLKMLIKDNSP